MITPEKVSEINQKLDALTALIADIQTVAAETKGEFTEKTCPLMGREHYEISQLLDGLGCYAWDCPFCSKHFEE